MSTDALIQEFKESLHSYEIAVASVANSSNAKQFDMMLELKKYHERNLIRLFMLALDAPSSTPQEPEMK